MNSKQGFCERIKYRYDDTGEERESSCIYWGIMGRVVDEKYYDRSTNKIYNKSQRTGWPLIRTMKRNQKMRCYYKGGGYIDYIFEGGKEYRFDWDIDRHHLTVHTDEGELLISFDDLSYWFE